MNSEIISIAGEERCIFVVTLSYISPLFIFVDNRFLKTRVT